MKDASTYYTWYADGAEPATLRLSRDVKPDIDALAGAVGWESAVKSLYQQEAVRVVDFLFAHMPQGLTDHIMAELCLRKATLFRLVPVTQPESKPMICATEEVQQVLEKHGLLKEAVSNYSEQTKRIDCSIKPLPVAWTIADQILEDIVKTVNDACSPK